MIDEKLRRSLRITRSASHLCLTRNNHLSQRIIRPFIRNDIPYTDDLDLDDQTYLFNSFEEMQRELSKQMELIDIPKPVEDIKTFVKVTIAVNRVLLCLQDSNSYSICDVTTDPMAKKESRCFFFFQCKGKVVELPKWYYQVCMKEESPDPIYLEFDDDDTTNDNQEDDDNGDGDNGDDENENDENEYDEDEDDEDEDDKNDVKRRKKNDESGSRSHREVNSNHGTNDSGNSWSGVRKQDTENLNKLLKRYGVYQAIINRGKSHSKSIVGIGHVRPSSNLAESIRMGTMRSCNDGPINSRMEAKNNEDRDKDDRSNRMTMICNSIEGDDQEIFFKLERGDRLQSLKVMQRLMDQTFWHPNVYRVYLHRRVHPDRIPQFPSLQSIIQQITQHRERWPHNYLTVTECLEPMDKYMSRHIGSFIRTADSITRHNILAAFLLHVVQGMFRAVQHLHQVCGILHRDISRNNVMIRPWPQSDERQLESTLHPMLRCDAVLIDCNMSATNDKKRLQICGTFPYAPFVTAKHCSEATDLFNIATVGITIYQWMLTGSAHLTETSLRAALGGKKWTRENYGEEQLALKRFIAKNGKVAKSRFEDRRHKWGFNDHFDRKLHRVVHRVFNNLVVNNMGKVQQRHANYVARCIKILDTAYAEYVSRIDSDGNDRDGLSTTADALSSPSSSHYGIQSPQTKDKGPPMSITRSGYKPVESDRDDKKYERSQTTDYMREPTPVFTSSTASAGFVRSIDDLDVRTIPVIPGDDDMVLIEYGVPAAPGVPGFDKMRVDKSEDDQERNKLFFDRNMAEE